MKLSDRQLDVMRVLWASEEAGIADVHAALEDQGLAYTTVATLLKRLEEKAAVIHRRDGRQFIYRAAIEESQVREGMVGNLVTRLFRGDPAAMVSHLLGDERLEEDDLKRIEALIRARGDDHE